MNGIKIRGTGRCVPAHIVTNRDMTGLVDTTAPASSAAAT